MALRDLKTAPHATFEEVREHPFAAFVRTVAKGSKLSRPLSRAEAREAMGMILAGEAEPVQIGAFLATLRYRKETPDELAGFVQAARWAVEAGDRLEVDLDWPSYADRHRQLPYFLLAALLLAGAGVRVLMHGIAGEGPVSTPRCLAALGHRPAVSASEAAAAMDRTNFAYLPLGVVCPALDRLFDLRPLLGLRSPANTYARELNPAAAPCQMQGVFHPDYIPLHRDTAQRLGQPHAAIFKGAGGEAQCNPLKPCRVALIRDRAPVAEVWPATLSNLRHGWRDDPLEPARLVALWHGEVDDPAPIGAVVGTAAVALKLLGRAAGQDEAEALADRLWQSRRALPYPIAADG